VTWKWTAVADTNSISFPFALAWASLNAPSRSSAALFATGAALLAADAALFAS